MTAVRLYGHDGQPLLVSTNAGALVPAAGPEPYGETGKARHAVTGEVVDVAKVREQLELDVRKTVRSRATSLIAGMLDRQRGKDKPTPVTFATLRLMANRSEWIRAILKTRKSQLGGVKWAITLKDGDDPSGAAQREADRITRLLKHPEMTGSRPTSKTWRTWLGMFLDDLLVLDAASAEKERNGRKQIVAIYNVDGATIRPNIDEQGGFHRDAYVQLVDGQVTARFGMEELLYAMDNPQTDVRFAGYGLSPLESLIISVTADLHAGKYNASYFEKGSVPEGILNLGQDVAAEDVDAFRLYWLNEVMGRPWSLPIIGGSEAPEFLQWRAPNRDMQFMEYQQWLLQKMCAVYQMAPKDLGQIEDVNRSTAEDASSSTEASGVVPLQSLIKDYIDTEIIGPHGEGLGDYLEFEWEQQGETADEINQKFAPLVSAGAASRKEWRDAHGLDDPPADVVGADGLPMHLADGQPQPLPSKEDIQHMGAAAEQQQQQDQREHDAQQAQQEPGQPTSTPWKPADPDHPETQDAIAAHDHDSGIGPRNLGKTAPDGHDRNPALTRRQDGLSDEFAAATTALVEGLTKLLA